MQSSRDGSIWSTHLLLTDICQNFCCNLAARASPPADASMLDGSCGHSPESGSGSSSCSCSRKRSRAFLLKYQSSSERQTHLQLAPLSHEPRQLINQSKGPSVSFSWDIMATKALVIAAVAVCCTTGSSATLINLINQCPYGVTAFARSGSSATNSYNLGASGGYQQLDVGSSFPAGLIFASTTGSEDNAQVGTC